MIIPMKKAHIVVLKTDQELLLKELQKSGELMVIKVSDTENHSFHEDGLINRTENAISLLSSYREKKPLFGDYNVVNYDDFDNISNERVELLASVEASEQLINQSEAEIKLYNEQLSTLLLWKDLPFPTNEMKKVKNVVVHTGLIENTVASATILKSFPLEYRILSNEDLAPIYFIVDKDDDEKLLDELRLCGYSETVLPASDELIINILNEKEELINKAKCVIFDEQQKLKQYSEKIQELQILNDQYMTNKALKEVNTLETKQTTYIEGWVRSDMVENLKKAISNAITTFDISFTDPLPDEEPPTYTKNNKVVSQFESITDMYSKPYFKERDPNGVMSFWYWVLFGMMMADAGYGLVIILGALLMKKLMHPKGNTLKLINIIMYSGITTIIWGVLFGSYFGFTIPGMWFWFSPMEDPMMMLIVSIVVGALHIITGLAFKAYDNIVTKNIPEALAKQISWILILLGIGAMMIPALKIAAIVMIALGVLFIILFAGCKKKNVLSRFGFGLIGLYDVTSYLSDILSYSRIMALAMSSASIAMVMNQLASMVGGGVVGTFFSVIIYIVGHTFNLVLGLLSAYVHDSRLQYIEFFGKFYEGGGIEFEPFALQTKYVNEIKF